MDSGDDQFGERLADQSEETDLRRFQFFGGFLRADAGRKEPFLALQAIGIRQLAAGDEIVDVGNHILMEGEIVPGFGNDLGLEQHFQIFPDDLQRDRLGPFEDAERGAVDACGLTVALRATGAAVEELLRNEEADIARIEFVVLDAGSAAAGIVQQAHARRRFHVDARQVEPAGLTKLKLRRLAVFDRLSDFRIRFECGEQRFAQRQSLRATGKCRSGAQRGRKRPHQTSIEHSLAP